MMRTTPLDAVINEDSHTQFDLMETLHNAAEVAPVISALGGAELGIRAELNPYDDFATFMLDALPIYDRVCNTNVIITKARVGRSFTGAKKYAYNVYVLLDTDQHFEPIARNLRVLHRAVMTAAEFIVSQRQILDRLNRDLGP